jgi:hypothetical protein
MRLKSALHDRRGICNLSQTTIIRFFDTGVIAGFRAGEPLPSDPTCRTRSLPHRARPPEPAGRHDATGPRSTKLGKSPATQLDVRFAARLIADLDGRAK